MRLLALCLQLFIIINIVTCAGLYNANSNVIQLTKNDFVERVLAGPETWLVEFYAPWCGHCKNLAPTWESAATSLKGVVNIAAVNCDEHQDLAGMFNVKGFPTIIYFGSDQAENPHKKGMPWKTPEVYQGGRTAGDISKYALSKLPNYVVSDKKVEQFLTTNTLNRVILFSEKNVVTNFYKALAVQFKNRLGFGQVSKSQTDLVTKFGITKFPSAVLVTKSGENIPYEGVLSPSNLAPFKEFLEKYAEPAQKKGGNQSSGSKQSAPEPDRPAEVVEIDTQEDFTSKIADKSGSAVLIAIDKSDELSSKYVATLLEVAEKYKKQFRFFSLDGPSHVEFLSKLHIDSGYPQLFVLNPKKKISAQFIGAFDDASIASFLDRVLAGSRRLIQPINELPAFV